MPVISSLLHLTAFKQPFLRTIVPGIGLAFGIQAAFAIPSILLKSERFYDLSGSLTYLSCTALSLYMPAIRARAAAAAVGATKPAWPSLFANMSSTGAGLLNWRQVVLSLAVSLWAARLGTFLFSRITAENGQDSRFDTIRGSPPKFLVAFMAQAAWVSLCLMPVLAMNSLPAATFAALPAFGITDILGILLYVGGITFEATADRQKSKWMQEKKEKKHSEEFLTRGLWGKSRHPNYFGEMTLWTGIATTSAGVLASKAGLMGIGIGTGLGGALGALAMAFVSPAFVSFLLLKVSGIPMSEGKYDKKFADNKQYQEWKKNTPMLIPKL